MLYSERIEGFYHTPRSATAVTAASARRPQQKKTTQRVMSHNTPRRTYKLSHPKGTPEPLH